MTGLGGREKTSYVRGDGMWTAVSQSTVLSSPLPTDRPTDLVALVARHPKEDERATQLASSCAWLEINGGQDLLHRERSPRLARSHSKGIGGRGENERAKWKKSISFGRPLFIPRILLPPRHVPAYVL